MKMIQSLAVLFYKYFVLLIGAFLLLYVAHLISYEDVIQLVSAAYHEMEPRTAVGTAAVIGLILNFFFWKSLVGDRQKGKTIAFDNPGGRVSVSLTALEDLVRRVIARVPEVREVRCDISAGKKGMEVKAKLTLNTDVNIPEMTSKLQEMVRRRINDTIGLEEAISVRVHITKIIPSEANVRRPKDKDDEKDKEDSEPTVPFQGYRA